MKGLRKFEMFDNIVLQQSINVYSIKKMMSGFCKICTSKNSNTAIEITIHITSLATNEI